MIVILGKPQMVIFDKRKRNHTNHIILMKKEIKAISEVILL